MSRWSLSKPSGARARQKTILALGNDRAGAFDRFLLSDLECGCEIFQTLCVELRRAQRRAIDFVAITSGRFAAGTRSWTEALAILD